MICSKLARNLTEVRVQIAGSIWNQGKLQISYIIRVYQAKKDLVRKRSGAVKTRPPASVHRGGVKSGIKKVVAS